jgi:GLPGLI family protein
VKFSFTRFLCEYVINTILLVPGCNLFANLARLFIYKGGTSTMKKIRYILTVSLAIFTIVSVFAQRKLTEATISYDIVINTSSATPGAADLLDGATSVIYLKGNSSRSEMISSLGTQATIIDGKTGDVTVLKEYGEQKYMIKMTADNWKESNKKYDGVTFVYSNEEKVIAGYTCYKAVGTLKDGTSFSVFYTKDLVASNMDFQYLNKNLPGLAMQYEATIGSMKVTYTVSGINFKPVSQVKFDLPKSGYRIMPYEETLGKGGNN